MQGHWRRCPGGGKGTTRVVRQLKEKERSNEIRSGVVVAVVAAEVEVAAAFVIAAMVIAAVEAVALVAGVTLEEM